MKKIVALLAVMFASLTVVLSITASAAELPFTDVKEKAWYYSYVKEAYEKGYMEGNPGGLFAPGDSVTRAQYVTILARLCNAEPDTDTGFSDVGSGKWYAGAVGWAVKAGIVTGYEDNTFRGNSFITRQELMVMTARYLDYIWVELPESDTAVKAFADKNKIAKWAAEYVDEMRAAGIVEGDNAGNFNPTKTATRAEIAAMTVRLGRSLEAYDAKASIGKTPLESYSLYSESLSSEQLGEIAASIKGATGVDLGISDTKTANSIVFGVDESLKRLQYGITEKDGDLYISVSSRFAVAYLPRITEAAFSLRDSFNIPKGYNGTGTYALDEAASAENVAFVCETDKNPLAYDLGDTVTFRVSLVDGDKLVSVPQFKYSYRDDKKEIKDVTVPGHAGQFVLSFDGLDIPGCGHLKVYALNRRGQSISAFHSEMNASVAFDFENIKAALDKPADFDEFWDAKIAELMTVEPRVLSSYECELCKRDGFKVYCMEIQSLDTVASVHITYPENAEPGSLKINGYFDGYGSAASDRADFASDAICVSVNRQEVKNHQSDEYYAEYEASIKGWGFNNPTREESYFLGMLMRDVQAMRFASEEYAELWNGKDMTVNGGSMGGFQSAAVAGLYDKVTHCSTSITWVCDVGGYTEGRLMGVDFPPYSEGSKYYDSCYFAERFDGSVTLFAGLGDMDCPTAGTISLYNTFSGEKTGSFVQCVEHGYWGSPYNLAYNVSTSNPKPDDMETVIVDNGCAVTPPNYSAERKLNASETKMKEAADLYNRKVRWLEVTYPNSSAITSEELQTLLKDALVTKCSLDPAFNIVVDYDSLEAVRTIFRGIDSGSIYIMVDYMITDDSGGYYDASARFLMNK